MNIGIFTDTYFPQINGVATSIRMLEKELNKLGHRVYIFTTSDPNVTDALPRVFRLPSMPFVFLPSTRLALLYPPKLLIHMRQLKLDVIHTQTEFPLGIFGKVVTEFLKIPLVHTYHTMYEDYVHYVAKGYLITPKMAQTYSRVFCNRASIVVAPVEKTKESLLDYGVVRPIEVVPTGIDFTPFSRNRFSKEDVDATKIELGLNTTDPVIVSLGRVAKEKSIEVIINGFPKLLERIPNAKLAIIGDGPIKAELEQLVKELNISDSVVFGGAKPWDIIGKYYMVGDVFITASTSETQGLTYIEAMAAKVPVIAKMDRSVEGILQDGVTGYSFTNDDEAADTMYRALSELKDENRRTEINNAAFNKIQHLSSKIFAQKIEDVYFQAIDNYKTVKKSKEDIFDFFSKNVK